MCSAGRPCAGGLPRSDDWSVAAPTAEERALAQRYVEAHGTFDPQSLAPLVTDDIRITMPPMPLVYDGLDALLPAFGLPEILSAQ